MQRLGKALLRRQKLGEKREDLGWGGGRRVNGKPVQKEYSRDGTSRAQDLRLGEVW